MRGHTTYPGFRDREGRGGGGGGGGGVKKGGGENGCTEDIPRTQVSKSETERGGDEERT